MPNRAASNAFDTFTSIFEDILFSLGQVHRKVFAIGSKKECEEYFNSAKELHVAKAHFWLAWSMGCPGEYFRVAALRT
jgi:hypothetical protein